MPAETLTRHPQQKDLTFLKSEVEDVDRKEKTLVVKITTDSVDRDKEIVIPAGIRLDNFNKNPVVLWAHDYRAVPIGKALWTKTEKARVLSKPKFAPYEFAQIIFDMYAEGFMKAWSIGFLPVSGKSHEPTEDELKARPDWAGARWIYDETELLEYSAVPVPSNADALSLALTQAMSKGLALPENLKSLVITPATKASDPKPCACGCSNECGCDCGKKPVEKDCKCKCEKCAKECKCTTHKSAREVITLISAPAPKAPAQLDVKVLEAKGPRQPEIKLLETAEEVEIRIRARLRGRVALD